MKLTKWLSIGVVLLGGVLVLTGCGQAKSQTVEEQKVVKLGVVGENNEPWEYVKKELADKENIQLELVKFTDYRTPITALEDGSIDLHACLTEIFMDTVNEESGYDNTTIAYTTLNPLGVYSNKIKDLKELEDEAIVAVPNDVSNQSRALLLLQTAGLIKVNPDKGLLPDISDIIENPKKLTFKSLDSNQTARALADVDISLINNGMAVDAGLIPTKDAIFLEPIADSSKPYYNVIAARKEEKDSKVYQKIIAAYQTDEVAKIIAETTENSSIPVWDKK
ncbi:MetQ/NlpA family ABC transporter substrate-binding protein [Candidatus Enterococcus ferrettii]|uniref:Lipoprotein n=1 Tax=Candidatus Enterococcus ferrettii TaxID=2815324 RepID=A0ABV0EXX9_9ENTE|nr:MetQ/NlpA family ABC transporter substrate-binding protein [Enterococcus sp. 665A]MBO1341735.1 MetQ/NlpA family ABC transporter substrate-binding protein [Enterococcus sp. 665A]